MNNLNKSIWQPFTVKLTIHLSINGVSCALLFTSTTVSAYVLMRYFMRKYS